MSASHAGTQTDVLSFLRRSETYSSSGSVAVIETHVSWVFLLSADVYKLKKAVRLAEADFTTPGLRRRNCVEEVRLNRRLAPGVYIGVVAVTRDAAGRLALGGEGEPVDWLVHMRRLPPDENLDAVIRSGRVLAQEPRIRMAARALARFFDRAAAEPVEPGEFRRRLCAGTIADLRELSLTRYALPVERVGRLARAQLRFLEACAGMFDARVAAGRIVEGHGDLRPEHIWIVPEPVILDCVEFDKSLRILDPADELAFLLLECARLGAIEVGAWFLEAYVQATGDEPPAGLVDFYRVYRALRRATIAARHLDDPSVNDPQPFLERARRYVAMVEPVECAIP